jgi:hypothetical protein
MMRRLLRRLRPRKRDVVRAFAGAGLATWLARFTGGRG